MDPEFARRLEQQASLIRQLQGALGGNRIVRGVVTESGGTYTLAEGDGFSISKVSTGVVTVTPTTAFSDVPAVLATSHDWACFTPEANLLASSFRISSFNTTTGAAVDAGFNFIAIGPA